MMAANVFYITKTDSDFLAVLFTFFLVLFVGMMPPFIGSGNANVLAVRLLLETLILCGLTIHLLLKRGSNPFLSIVIIFALYMMNWMFSEENIRQVLSHFNKIALLFLLSEVLIINYSLVTLLRKVWVIIWTYFCLLAIIVFFLYASGLAKISHLGDPEYDYYYYPYLGSVLFKNLNGVLIPRYTGFLDEPIMFGFFTGFNIVVAQWIFVDRIKMWGFLVLNMLAGLLTISFAFYIFIALFFVFWRPIKRIPSKYVIIGGIFFIILVGLLGHYVSFPYSSFSDRVGRYSRSIQYISHFQLENILFGVGAMPFLRGIGSGSASALIDIFVSRGVFLFFIWSYLLHLRCKYIPGLFFFIIFYSLFVDIWYFPLFIVGVAVVTSYVQISMSTSLNRSRIRHQTQPVNAAS